MDIANILIYKFPTSPFSVGETYESLLWLDKEIPKPTLDELQSYEQETKNHYLIIDIQRAIKSLINEVAVERNYNDEQSLVGYFNSGVELWRNESIVYIGWRDSIWNYAFQELLKFQSGEREIATVEDFLKELPSIVWPN